MRILFYGFLFLSVFFLFQVASAVDKVKHTKQIEVVDNPYKPSVGILDTKANISLKLTNFEESSPKNSNTNKIPELQRVKPVVHSLIVSINKTNHFYLSKFHVVAAPFKWIRETQSWQADLKFYKKNGQLSEAEVYIGTLSLVGKLELRENQFILDAKARRKFKNTQGTPLLIAESKGVVDQEKGPIAKR